LAYEWRTSIELRSAGETGAIYLKKAGKAMFIIDFVPWLGYIS
jgi:hypothetical protein